MAKEICDVLELTSHKVSLQILRSKYEEIKVDIDGVILTYPIPDSIGRQQNTKFVSKQGMYDLILQSRKKEAFKFRIWVTSDVLPEIYKADNGKARKLTRKLTPWFVEISSSRTNKRFI